MQFSIAAVIHAVDNRDWYPFLQRLSLAALSVPASLTFWTHIAGAQTIRANLDGTNTQVVQSGSVFNISGGARSESGGNLFQNFQEFGLSTGQTANFIVEPAIQNILGKVSGGNTSNIDGLIQVSGSDANLFLINPSGIMFGPNASLNLPAAFTATTADALGFGNGSETNWLNAFNDNSYAELNGNPTAFAFTSNLSGSIWNEGNLTLSSNQPLRLLAGSVVNLGTLSTVGGEVTVAAVPGEKVVRLSNGGASLNLRFDPLVAGETGSGAVLPGSFSPPSLPELLTGSGLSQATGVQVQADGTVVLTGVDDAVVNVSMQAGTTLVSGQVDVSAESSVGGAVHVLGDRVALVGAAIDASGGDGGGEVQIGGGYQGRGTVPNALRTFVSLDSSIAANAAGSGDGGNVVVWADGRTGFFGDISARGGQQAGDGGRVEVSGLESLEFWGEVDTTADFGEIGQLLLDPTNIEVVAAGGTATSLEDVDAFADSNLGAGELTTINADLISNANTNVTLQASNDITFSADINIAAPGVGLTAQANNNIDVNASIATTGGDISLLANSDSLGSGSIEIQESNIVANGGDINISGRGEDGGSGNIGIFVFGDSNISTNGSGTIELVGESGNGVDINRAIRIASRSSLVTEDGNISVTGTANGDIGGAGVVLDSNAAITTTGFGNITIAGNGSQQGGSGGSPGLTIGGGSTVNTQNGNIELRGVGGISSVRSNEGVLIANEGTLISTNNSGAITVIGIGGTSPNPNTGIKIQNDARLSTVDGLLSLEGFSSNASGIQLEDNSTLSTTGQGQLALFAEGANSQSVFNFTAANIETSNLVSISSTQSLVFGDLLFNSPLTLNSTQGSITTGNISIDSSDVPQDRNGDISINAATGVQTGNLITTPNSEFVDAGNISLISQNGDIQVGDVDAGSVRQGEGEISGRGGNITINAREGNVQTSALISRSSATGDDSNSRGGGDIFINAGEQITIAGNINVLSSSTQGFADDGGDITITAGGNIETEQLSAYIQTRQGSNNAGNITVESTSGDITIQDLVRASIGLSEGGSGSIGNGGDIQITANQGSIAVSQPIRSAIDLQPGFNLSAGNAGSITLNAGERIDVGNLDARAVVQGTQVTVGDGGNVNVQAQTAIQTAGIFTNSSQGNAGNVFIDPIGDVQVATINATAPNGLGGSIDITAGQNFRATDSFLDFNDIDASLSSAGELGGGDITLRHNRTTLTPFIIGDSSINGTAAAITTSSTNTLAPTRIIPGVFNQGNITLISQAALPQPEPIGIRPSELPSEDEKPVLDVQASEADNLTLPPAVVALTVEDSEQVSTVQDAIATIEQTFTEQYENYFDEPLISFNPSPTPTSSTDPTPILSPSAETSEAESLDVASGILQPKVEKSGQNPSEIAADTLNQAGETIKRIADLTDTRPGIVYVFFAPPNQAVSDVKTTESLTQDAISHNLRSAQTLWAFNSESPMNNSGFFNTLRLSEGKIEDAFSQTTCEGREDHWLTLILVDHNEKRTLKQVPGITCPMVIDMASQMRRAIIEKDRYRRPALQLYSWILQPLKAELDNAAVSNLVFIMDRGLRALPLAALFDGEKHIIDRYSVGLMPSLSLTNTEHTDLRQTQVLASGVADFGFEQNLQDLYAVPFELESVTTGRDGTTLMNEQVTRSQLRIAQNTSPAPIIHLATHAEFNRGNPKQSFIQLWNEKLRLTEIQDMGWNNPIVELLVLSACETASDNEDAELGFAGFTNKAGVKSTLASIWTVGDVGTAGLMTEFYRRLQSSPIKAEALRQAQIAMATEQVQIEGDRLHWSDGFTKLPNDVLAELKKQRRKPDLSHPYYWAGFTIVGNPW